MKNSKASEQLTLRWVPVVDAHGRTHMEAVWIMAGQQSVHTTHAA